MSAGGSQNSERFAAAVEYGWSADAVPPGDDELRQELEMVALLRQSRATTGPDADASARMRAKVMAAAATMLSTPDAEQTSPGVTPGLISVPAGRTSFEDAPTKVAGQPVAEDADLSDEETQVVAPSNVVGINSARGRHRSSAGIPVDEATSPQRRGLLGVSAAAALLVLAVTGGGALFSRDALPGDSLYGVKQTTESALTGLTSGQSKAQRQLDSASTRLDEVQQLNSEPASNSRDADISQALHEFDEQSAAGSRTRLASAGPGNGAELGSLANWAQAQSTKLSSMRSSLPASAQPDADHSMRQLEDIRTRAQSLNNRQGCDSVTSGETDQLGPLPSKNSCSGKVATSAPTTTSVLPPGSSNESRSNDRSSSSSDSDNSRESSDPTRSTRSTKDDGPDLPVVGGITGGSDSGGGLPGRQNTRGQDSVPTTDQAPKSGGLLGGNNLLGGLLGGN
jgi:hypothetical protein